MTGALSTEHNPPRTSPSWWHVLLSLLAVNAIGFAQPLLDLIGRNGAFLVAHEATSAQVAAMVAVVVLGPPLVLAAAVAGLRALAPTAAAALHLVALAAGAAVTVLVVVNLAGGTRVPGALSIAVAVTAGASLAYAYRRSTPLRRYWHYGALAAPAVVLIFLFATPVRGLVDPDASAVSVTIPDDLPPVVMVVFDELPLASMLDLDGAFDDALFPSFARLAGTATWFPNTTASHAYTVAAVPTTLSGRYAEADELPGAGHHPTNLLALLAPAYDVIAHEPMTDLCPVQECPRTSSPAARYAAFARDVAILGAHVVVPTRWGVHLPELNDQWRDFGRGPEARAGEPVQNARRRHAVAEDHPADFRRFVDRIVPGTTPPLYFFHSMLPHRPWRYLPDGRLHTGGQEPAVGEGNVWTNRLWPVQQGYQLHLAQAQLADRLLGTLLDRLEDQQMFDETLVVVVADHGASFTPGFPRRDITKANFGEIGPVPFLIKAPRQRVSSVVETGLDSSDVLPTILDVLGVQPPNGLDGRSGFDATAARASKTVFDLDYRPWVMPTALSGVQLDAVVRRKHAWFADGAGGVDLHRLAPPTTHQLLGRRVNVAERPAHEQLRVALRYRRALSRIDHHARTIPALITGTVEGLAPGERPVLAVGVNGRVEAVTMADLGNERTGAFRALVPPKSLREGANTVEIFLVVGDDLQPILTAD